MSRRLLSNWPDSMPSNSTSVHPRSPVLRLVPTFQLLLSMMLESALLNWPDKVEERTPGHDIGVLRSARALGGIELAYAQQVEYLHAHLLVGGDVAAHNGLHLIPLVGELQVPS